MRSKSSIKLPQMMHQNLDILLDDINHCKKVLYDNTSRIHWPLQELAAITLRTYSLSNSNYCIYLLNVFNMGFWSCKYILKDQVRELSSIYRWDADIKDSQPWFVSSFSRISRLTLKYKKLHSLNILSTIKSACKTPILKSLSVVMI